MTDSKHTPGPWESADYMKSTDPGFPIFHKPKQGPRIVIGWTADMGNLEIENANSKFLTAAPEMAEALAKISREEDLPTGGGLRAMDYAQGWNSAIQKLRSIARNALKKAGQL